MCCGVSNSKKPKERIGILSQLVVKFKQIKVEGWQFQVYMMLSWVLCYEAFEKGRAFSYYPISSPMLWRRSPVGMNNIDNLHFPSHAFGASFFAFYLNLISLLSHTILVFTNNEKKCLRVNELLVCEVLFYWVSDLWVAFQTVLKTIFLGNEVEKCKQYLIKLLKEFAHESFFS